MIRNSKNKEKILVIVHDAGGAEMISAYVQKHRHYINFQSYVAGPAEAIFRRYKIPFSIIENKSLAIKRMLEKNIDIKSVIIGTMWNTRLELIALQTAKHFGLNTIVYIDAWINYRERFDYPKKGWQKNLPDELWVGDIEAQKMATKLFPATLQIKLAPNQYFANLQKQYKILKENKKQNRILFLTNSSDNPTSALLILHKVVSTMQNKPAIRIRFHPSDNRKWFSVFKVKYNFPLEVSKKHDLVEDLAQVCVVVGPQTTALVVALLCGLSSICIKSRKTKLMLPFNKIHNIVSAAELQKELQNVFMHQKIT